MDKYRENSMVLVENLLASKAKVVWQINPEASVYAALKLMDDKGIGALAVTQHDKLVGIISERDYARKVILKGHTSQATKVEDIMTKDVLYTFPKQKIEDCMVVMTERHIRHMPVIEDNKLVGVITLGDVVKAIIEEQQIKIDHLEQTISWGESY